MDYDYDTYENELEENEYREYEDDMDRSEMTLDQTIYQCIAPTYSQTYNFLFNLIVWNIVFRISTQLLPVPKILQHTLSMLCGLICIYYIFPVNYVLLFILPCACYFPLRLLKSRGLWVSLLCGGFLMFCELFWLEPRRWHQIRGSQMVLLMKAVSLAFDLDLGIVNNIPGILEYFGYMFCPGNCVFGPWTSFLDYQEIFKSPKWRIQWLVRIFSRNFLSMFFLGVSSCWVYYIFPETQWKWIIAYRDALSFRSSHYFVSYASEMSLLLAGFMRLRLADDVSVVRPRHVEVPRSLIQVVVSWNIPMHCWLKIYVFNTSLRFGNFLAIMITYLASALLHGLNFQLASVLLSLGLFSYVEYMLRKKLATTFSACILARPCKADCSHVYKWKQPGVLGVNFLFSLLSLLHLAYLGVVFQDSDSSDTGFSYQHTLSEWSKLGYLSHYIALFSYIFYFLI